MMPKGWKEVKLGEVINHQKGYAFKSDSYITEGVRIIRISDTTRNSIHDNSPVYIDENETASLSQYKLNAEDIILSTVGSRPHLLDSMVGKAVKVPVKDRGALLNQNLVKIVPKNSLITNNYLFSMITKSKFNYFISTLVRGNANQVSITLKELFAYTFPLPPLPEQQKIAKILSTWDKAISTTERLIDNSTQQKKSLVQQLLTGRKRLLNETGKRFESEWVRTELRKLLKEEGARNKGDKIQRVLSVTNHSGFVLPEEQFSKRVASKETSNYKIVRKGQFGYNPSRINVGSFARLDEYEEGVLSPMYVVFSVLPKKLSSDYFYQWMHSHEAKQRINNSTQGSVRNSVNFSSLEAISLSVPNLEEQQKIATVLTNADKEIELLEQQLADLQQEKKALMQVLLTGKKRVVVNG